VDRLIEIGPQIPWLQYSTLDEKKGEARKIYRLDAVAAHVPFSLCMTRSLMTRSQITGSLKLWLPVCLGLLLLASPAVCLHAGEKLGAAGAAPAALHDMQGVSAQIESLSTAVGPKVVQIATQGLKVAGTGDPQPAGVLVAERGRGSGFFVAADGYVLTNAHVISGATRIKVMVQPVNVQPVNGQPVSGGAPASAPREYSASVVGVDADNDLALLKIEAQGVPFFDLSRGAAPRQGQLVVAFGSPMGLAQSASLGLVSAVERQLNPDDPRTYIQTDASLNPGNSGGPLVDLEGSLLGINTMILSQSGGSEGIGFAVPLDVIRHAYAGLREKGTLARPLLGIQLRSLNPELIAGLGLKARQGVLVEDADPYGPATAAGLLPGDVMLSLNAEPIRNMRDLYRIELALSAGAPVELTVMRGPDARLLRITPAAPRKTASALSGANVTEKDNLVFRLGLYGDTLTPAMAAGLGGFRQTQGVLVLALAGLGLTGQNTIEPGDVVHAVNGSAVDTVESLRSALETVPDGAPVVLQIERAGMLVYLTPGTIVGSEQRPRNAGSARTPGRAVLQY
jgi:serine protease Do